MQENKFKMKHLIGVLKALKLASVQELLKYLNDCFIYELKEFQTLENSIQIELKKTKEYEPHEMVNILVKTDEVKYHEFVIACLVSTKKISEDDASDLIENTTDLYKLGIEFQNEIIAMQSIVTEPADPNEPPTN
jgi:hypothetical protein